ncbi:hypothetical protein DAI22_08g243800 [Oryza sativa Japonica Group]|nr:hypothetical protein DAI22_08g243800 [Oryza sativa Japonica Group]
MRGCHVAAAAGSNRCTNTRTSTVRLDCEIIVEPARKWGIQSSKTSNLLRYCLLVASHNSPPPEKARKSGGVEPALASRRRRRRRQPQGAAACCIVSSTQGGQLRYSCIYHFIFL